MNKYLEKVAEWYREEADSEVTHDGGLYNVNKLLAITQRKGHPVVAIPISELEWQLEFGEADPDRVAKADVTKPIIVSKYGDKFAIVDGFHRLNKAKQLGKRSIKAKVIHKNVMEQAKVK